MKAAQPEIMKRQMDVLYERSDLTNRPAKDVICPAESLFGKAYEPNFHKE